MRTLFPYLLLACFSTGAFAAGRHDTVKMQDPVQHVTLVVSRRAASVGIIGHGQVEFRPEALVSHGRTVRLKPAMPRSSGGRIVQTLGHGLEAWYIDTPFGIEQGFVLSSPPGGDDVNLRLALGGALLPYRQGSGLRFSAFRDPKPALNYSRLVAYDADHRRLPARMVLTGQTLTLSVDARGARYPLTLDPLLNATPVPLTTPDAISLGSLATSTDGKYVIVGAPYSHTNAGEAYIFARSGNAWGSPVLLPNPQGSAGSLFGISVAMSADGGTVLVGAPAASTAMPAAYVYTRNGATWTQAATLSTVGVAPSGGVVVRGFGFSSALSADGDVALVGAPEAASVFAGAVYEYRKSGVIWSGPVALPGSFPSSALAGSSVSLSSDGTTALILAPGEHTLTGALYITTYNGSSWSTPAPLTLPPFPATIAGGMHASLSGDGHVVLMGRPGETLSQGAAYAYVLSSGTWNGPTAIPMASVPNNSHFGTSVALSQDGSKAVVGAAYQNTNAGAAYVLVRSGSTWSDPVALSNAGQGSGSNLGYSVALTADGRMGFVGATGTSPGFVYSSPVAASFSATPSQHAGPVLPGSQITYQFAVDNADNDIDATGLVLDEVLPVGASYVSSNADSGSCLYTAASNSVTCTLASLPAGSIGANGWQPSITLTTAGTGGAQINTVGLSADQALDGVATASDTFYNDVPTVATDGTLAATSGLAAAGTLHASIAYPYPGETLSYAVVRKPEHGSLNLDAVSGAYSYTSAIGFTGSDEFTFKVSDGVVTSNTATVSVRVNAAGTGGGGSSSGGGGGGLGWLILLCLFAIYAQRRGLAAARLGGLPRSAL